MGCPEAKSVTDILKFGITADFRLVCMANNNYSYTGDFHHLDAISFLIVR